MRKNLILALLSLFGISVYIAAQQSQPPDVLTPNTAASTANTNYLLWNNSQNVSLWAAITQLQTSTANLPQDEANITALQSTVATQATQITALQTQLTSQGQLIQQLQQTVASLSTPQSASTTATFSSLPDGPLNGIGPGSINFGTGFWCVKSGELLPCADGQPQRAWTFPRAVSITNVTFSTTTIATTGATFTSAAGQKVQATAGPVNQDTSVSLNFSTTTTSVTIGALPSTGSAPDLRFRSITYQ